MMKDLVQCTITRRDLQHWLLRGPASLMLQDLDDRPVCPLVKMVQSPGLDYLYHVPLQNGTITWDRAPEFIGVYKLTTGGNNTLYLTPEFANSSICIQAELISPEWKNCPTMKEKIIQRIGQYIDSVIANDRRNLTVTEVTGWAATRELRNYREYGAKNEAEQRFFEDRPPDGQFRHGYTLDELPEAAFLAYLQAPEHFVKTEAEQHMKRNQEAFLLQILKTEALLAEYQTLMQDTGSPLHQMKAITQAVKASGAKTVSVTIQRDGKELTFKAEADSLLGQRSSYNASRIAAPDRRRFEQEFGLSWDYRPEEITKITYGKNTIYEAPPDQTEVMEEGLKMGGMTL